LRLLGSIPCDNYQGMFSKEQGNSRRQQGHFNGGPMSAFGAKADTARAPRDVR
jgi:hypothetical protein